MSAYQARRGKQIKPVEQEPKHKWSKIHFEIKGSQLAIFAWHGFETNLETDKLSLLQKCYGVKRDCKTDIGILTGTLDALVRAF